MYSLINKELKSYNASSSKYERTGIVLRLIDVVDTYKNKLDTEYKTKISEFLDGYVDENRDYIYLMYGLEFN